MVDGDSKEKFLEIKDIKKGFGEGDTRQEVLQGVSFAVNKGEICVLLGPSGNYGNRTPHFSFQNRVQGV